MNNRLLSILAISLSAILTFSSSITIYAYENTSSTKDASSLEENDYAPTDILVPAIPQFPPSRSRVKEVADNKKETQSNKNTSATEDVKLTSIADENVPLSSIPESNGHFQIMEFPWFWLFVLFIIIAGPKLIYDKLTSLSKKS